jgi:hypothetical protein
VPVGATAQMNDAKSKTSPGCTATAYTARTVVAVTVAVSLTPAVPLVMSRRPMVRRFGAEGLPSSSHSSS